MLRVYDLKTEYRTNPYGIGAVCPRFSWKMESDRQGVMQKSYRIKAYHDSVCRCKNTSVGDTENQSKEKKLLWDSGVVVSGESQRVRYAGEKLRSAMEVTWQVEVTVADDTGYEETAVGGCVYDDSCINQDESRCDVTVSKSDGPAKFTMGLLEERDWNCTWIEPEGAIDIHSPQPSPMLRRTFMVKDGLKRAYICQTAHGLYEYWINGKLGTEDKFKPGLTSYYYRIQYQMQDITNLLEEGENVWAVQLGDGWWRGTCGGNRNSFGSKCQFFGQIVLEYIDGGKEIIGTDEAFKWNTGGLLVSDMFMGDIYDAGLEPEGWKCTGFDDFLWKNVHLARASKVVQSDIFMVEDPGNAKLIPSRSVPVREMECFDAKITHDAQGRLVLDFGQNIAGYVRMKLRNTKAGQIVQLTHGEDIDSNGNFSQENIRQMGCKLMPHFQETLYTCKGADVEEYCPMFSIHGFRYVLLEGYEESHIQDGDFQAVAVYSAMEETGDFICSNPLINQLVKNSRWSQKGNFMDVAVDCPTRERNAWTGDNQIYVKTAARFMNVYPFYEKWLQDQTIEQFESGKVSISFPSTTSVHRPETLEELKKTNPLAALAGPTGEGSVGEDCAGWGDAAAYIPYMIYLSYGDKQILVNQYETAKKWVDYMLSCAKEHNDFYKDLPQYHTVGEDGILDAEFIYDTRMHYGEWQEPLQNQGDVSVTPELVALMMKMGKPLVATAYMCRSAGNVADMASVLGKTEDAAYYRKTVERIKDVYEKYLIKDDGTIEPGHQAAYVRALTMELCTGEKRDKVAEHLVKEVIENDYRLNTGFLSTPFLLPTLVEIGRSDLAFRLLEQTEAPSWLHPVLLGATTILEGWYSLDHHTDSHNHYSFGAVCDFLFGYVAGIRPLWEKPGYEEFVLQPICGGSLTEAKGEYESSYGTIISQWKLVDGKFHYECRIPVNTKATVILPDGSSRKIGSGSYQFRCEPQI